MCNVEIEISAEIMKMLNLKINNTLNSNFSFSRQKITYDLITWLINKLNYF